MRKNIKMILVLLVIILTGTLFAPGEVAKASEDVIIIYVQAPDEWQSPSVWAWSEDGLNAFENWPGGAMAEDPNNEGWYYSYVPNWVSSVIINANEGTIQTSDMATNSQNIWITISSPEEVIVSKEQLTNGDLPEYINMITINAQVPEDWVLPSLWAFSAPDGTNVFANWPGQELELASDGWFSYEVPGWTNTVIVNANIGEVQTADISIESKDVWIVVEDADHYILTYEKPAVEVAGEDLITVYAMLPSDWLLPSLWAWSAPDGTNVFPNWPGQELNVEGNWYSYSVPNWVNSIIINGNLGEVQTADISIEPEDVWVIVKDAEAYEIFYEKPSDIDVADDAEEVIVEEPENNEVDNTDESAVQESSNTGIIIGIVVIIIAGSGGYIYIKKKKK